MIADGACCKSAGGQKDFKAPGTGRVLEQVAARMKRVMGLTAQISRPQYAGRLERRVRHHKNYPKLTVAVSTAA